jgi:hypothetical protein
VTGVHAHRQSSGSEKQRKRDNNAPTKNTQMFCVLRDAAVLWFSWDGVLAWCVLRDAAVLWFRLHHAILLFRYDSIKSLKKRTHGLPRHGRIQGETKARQRTHGEGDCKGAVYHPRAVVRVGELARVIGCIQACMHHPPPCACSSTVEDRPSVVCDVISVWQNSWLECHVRAPVPLRTDLQWCVTSSSACGRIHS